MIVIADTSPTNYLVLIDAIGVLPELYDKIVIPNAVFDELNADETPEKVRKWILDLPNWFTIQHITILIDPNLAELDKGESEAIKKARFFKNCARR